MRFSQYFELNRTQPELDFVDVDTDHDIPLFIDPYAFSKRTDYWSLSCHNRIVSFFQTAIDSIREGNDQKAKLILNNLSEPNDTFLGYSRGEPRGKGVSGKQALDLYEKLSESKAVQTGLITELSDCELLIDGIGFDKISDITTNIIRGLLIGYTQAQCHLHDIELKGTIASGRIWDAELKEWIQDYVNLPIIDDKRVILVPKASVRWAMSLDSQEYYRHFVLNFLKDQHIQAGSSLVKVLKSGIKIVTKKDLIEINPMTKKFLYDFSKKHPSVLEAYKRQKAGSKPLNDGDIVVDKIDEPIIAEGIIARLREIAPGMKDATKYHHLMIGALEFIFYPDFIYPKKEDKLHNGRKRIDITYTNNATTGFFFRIHTDSNIASNLIMVECKNYSSDPENPELDQLAGRFSTYRGKFGILLARTFEDRDLFINRCKDTVQDGRGFIVPLVDRDITELLSLIVKGKRDLIDNYIESIFHALLA